MDKMDEGVQKIQICSYEISHGGVTYIIVAIVNHTILHIWSC